MNNLNIIFSYLGGSHSYGLNTENSDKDIRGIYLSEDVFSIFGMVKDEHKQGNGEDEKYHELRHFLRLCRNGNPEAIEMMYFRGKPIYKNQFWDFICEKPHLLIDPHKFFKSLVGYTYGELKRANGERTGKLGGKRKTAIDKYGFSPKNFCQLLRLCFCGEIFFKEGYFPVDVKEYNLFHKLMDIKMHPEKYSREYLNSDCEESMGRLKEAYNNSSILNQFSFDEDYVKKILLDSYTSNINILQLASKVNEDNSLTENQSG